MKKDIPYREQLLELSKLYKVPEVKSYIKSKKNLTTSQLELILLKNKIPLPAQSYSRKHVAEIRFKEQVITNIILSYYIFNELPDNWTYLGLFIIVLSGLYISRREIAMR